MAYFVLESEPHMGIAQTQQLNQFLGSIPNGTILSMALYIRCTPLAEKGVYVYWIAKIPDEKDERVIAVRNQPGVLRFEMLSGIDVTPCDREWRFEDSFIDALLVPLFGRHQPTFGHNSFGECIHP